MHVPHTVLADMMLLFNKKNDAFDCMLRKWRWKSNYNKGGLMSCTLLSRITGKLQLFRRRLQANLASTSSRRDHCCLFCGCVDLETVTVMTVYTVHPNRSLMYNDCQYRNMRMHDCALQLYKQPGSFVRNQVFLKDAFKTPSCGKTFKYSGLFT